MTKLTEAVLSKIIASGEEHDISLRPTLRNLVLNDGTVLNLKQQGIE